MNFATIHEAAQADARQIVRGVIDVTPAGCAARKARIEVAAYDRRVREGEMALAREIYRRHGIHDEGSFLLALQNIHAATTGDSPYKARLLELMTDLADEMREGEPTIDSVPTYGEYDGFIQRSVR